MVSLYALASALIHKALSMSRYCRSYCTDLARTSLLYPSSNTSILDVISAHTFASIFNRASNRTSIFAAANAFFASSSLIYAFRLNNSTNIHLRLYANPSNSFANIFLNRSTI